MVKLAPKVLEKVKIKKVRSKTTVLVAAVRLSQAM